ncbi:protein DETOXIFICATION 43-like [Arachis ipaensis]|uniref:protein DETOXIFICATION 43-like n=1 Tax=Arachis ipaensis TaxID=130454 RepID=UPI000A2B4476|nr:protein DETOXIFICATION 43-like [Arachis ipaensis]XP_025647865.1 protein DETOXIFICATION 43-like [Arachis hypogaea]
MAAFQTCLQVWLTSSLLVDGLAVAVQAILACAFAEKNFDKVTAVATRLIYVSNISFINGFGNASLYDFVANFIILLPQQFVAATQPINSLAFVFDGVNYGASDFAYSAYSLVLVSLAKTDIVFSDLVLVAFTVNTS